MSMSLDRAIKVQSSGVTQLRDVYATARICKETHTALIARIGRVYESLPKSTPRHVREFLQGYNRALGDALWSDVEFCYRNANGVVFSTHRDSAHRKTEEFYQAGLGRELGDMESAHVWKGTDKPYTAWSVTPK